eukprot:3746852-Prymnesium_polylepis.3
MPAEVQARHAAALGWRRGWRTPEGFVRHWAAEALERMPADVRALHALAMARVKPRLTIMNAHMA